MYISSINLDLFRSAVITASELLQLNINVRTFCSTRYDHEQELLLTAELKSDKEDREVYVEWKVGDKIITLLYYIDGVGTWKKYSVNDLLTKSDKFLREYLDFVNANRDL